MRDDRVHGGGRGIVIRKPAAKLRKLRVVRREGAVVFHLMRPRPGIANPGRCKCCLQLFGGGVVRRDLAARCAIAGGRGCRGCLAGRVIVGVFAAAGDQENQRERYE